MTCFLKTCQTPGFLLILLFAQFAGQILHFAAISRASNYMPFLSTRLTFQNFFLCLSGTFTRDWQTKISGNQHQRSLEFYTGF